MPVSLTVAGEATMTGPAAIVYVTVMVCGDTPAPVTDSVAVYGPPTVKFVVVGTSVSVLGVVVAESDAESQPEGWPVAYVVAPSARPATARPATVLVTDRFCDAGSPAP